MDPSTHQGSPSQRLPGSHDSNDNDHNQQHRVRFAEGEPQASYPIYQPTPKREPPHATTSLAAPPAVYWDNQKHGESDRESDANLAGYTFYREGTPPPPGYGGPEKRLGRGGGPAAPIGESSTVGGGTIRSDGDYSIGPLNPLDTNWDQNDRNSIPPAKRKKVRWAIIAAVVLVIIAIAVGLGVGLGVGLPKDKGAHADAAEQPSSPIPVPGPQNSPAPTDPPTTTPGGTGAAADATTGSAAAPRPTYNSDCPALNDTIYNVPGSTLSFRRLCGVDYSGSGATDLAHAYTDSMADCMNTCASFDQCTACAWGYLEGDHAGKHRCYMKKDLKKSHKAASDWCFAMVQ